MLAHESNEPIFITKNGEGDLVVLSMPQYRQLQIKLELFGKLAEAQAQITEGVKTKTVTSVINDLRKKLHEKKERG
jgi:PHD/YefM family antitoxin component YafN of YafNO toxin-antitoxin module